MCVQSWLRPFLRSSGGAGSAGSPFKPVYDHIVIILLGPQHARKAWRITLRVSSASVRRNERGVEFIRFSFAQRESVYQNPSHSALVLWMGDLSEPQIESIPSRREATVICNGQRLLCPAAGIH